MNKKIKKYGPMGGDPGFSGPGPNMAFKTKDKKPMKKKKKVAKGGYSGGGGGLEMSRSPKPKSKKKDRDLLAIITAQLGKMDLTKEGEDFIKACVATGYFDKDKNKGKGKKTLDSLLSQIKQKKGVKKEAPSTPGMFFVKSEEVMAKAFEDRWLLEVGDEFKKLTTSHNLPFEFIDHPEGSQRNYIFKVGECEVIYSTMGADAKMKLRHPENPVGEHLAIAKHLYSRLMRSTMPLVKKEFKAAHGKSPSGKFGIGALSRKRFFNQAAQNPKGGSKQNNQDDSGKPKGRAGWMIKGLSEKGKELIKGRPLYGTQYSSSWQEGLGAQQNRRRKLVQQRKERGKGYRKPTKSIGLRRLAETQRRLFGGMEEQRNVGKSEKFDKPTHMKWHISEDLGDRKAVNHGHVSSPNSVDAVASFKEKNPHLKDKKLRAVVVSGSGHSPEVKKYEELPGHALWQIAEHKKDGTTEVLGKMSGKHSVEALRRFKEENPHFRDADLQAWVAPREIGPVMKVSLSKKGREVLKAFGLNPQLSQRKHTMGTHTGRGRVNIARQAGAGVKGAASPQQASASPMGKTKKVAKVNAPPVVKPSNPKTVTPSVDTPKAKIGKSKKVKKILALSPSSRTTDSGQGDLEA